MKRVPIILFILLIFAGVGFAADSDKGPLSLPVKELYAAPDEASNLIYKIPIDVELLDVSADANWHKVRISFKFGPIGYTYVGWAKVPVGEVLASRTEKLAKTLPDESPLP